MRGPKAAKSISDRRARMSKGDVRDPSSLADMPGSAGRWASSSQFSHKKEQSFFQSIVSVQMMDMDRNEGKKTMMSSI